VYWRQKALLHMLLLAGRPVSRMELMTWAFLLSREAPSRGGPTFYDFVPYHEGPFSFALHQEIGKLVKEGVAEEPRPRTWTASTGAHRCTRDLPPAVRRDATLTVRRLKDTPLRALIDDVHGRYPSLMTAGDESRRPLPSAGAAVYTLGYEGASIDAFLSTLVLQGLGAIIDVRQDALSRRYGFHGSTLSRLCGRLGISYTHLPELGVPRPTRKQWRERDDLSELMAAYEERVEADQDQALRAAANLAAASPTALVCMEAKPSRCHRSCLARLLGRRTGLKALHLRVETCGQAT